MKITTIENPRAYITHEPGDKDAWICICGNRPDSDGFYSCDADGNEVEPTPRDWKTDWYVCARCGRMIDVDTLEIVGWNEYPKFLAYSADDFEPAQTTN